MYSVLLMRVRVACKIPKASRFTSVAAHAFRGDEDAVAQPIQQERAQVRGGKELELLFRDVTVGPAEASPAHRNPAA